MTEQDQPTTPSVSSDFYRRLCHRAAVALVATDIDGRIVCWNSAASTLLGASADKMLGQHVLNAIPQPRRRLFGKIFRRTIAHAETNQFEVRIPDKVNGEKVLLVILSAIPDADGNVEGVAGWIVDETHRRNLSEKLAQAEKIASLGTLAGGVAHHFNNILGGVGTFVDYALTKGDIGSMKRALQMTAEASARAAKITQSLLSFAEKDMRNADLADLTEVVLTFSHLVERPLSEKHIQLKLSLKPVPIVPVEANRMHQVLGNLLTNAEEAMPEGGSVILELDRMGDDVILKFSDTGNGIDPEKLPLVFEPFYTSKGLLAGGDRSNPGLGLSVVHGIVMEMGGRITAQSPPGQGATFIITFTPTDDS